MISIIPFQAFFRRSRHNRATKAGDCQPAEDIGALLLFAGFFCRVFANCLELASCSNFTSTAVQITQIQPSGGLFSHFSLCMACILRVTVPV